MKKLALLLPLLLTLALLVSCGSQPAQGEDPADDTAVSHEPGEDRSHPDNFYNAALDAEFYLGMPREDAEKALEETKEVPVLADEYWATTYGSAPEGRIIIGYSIETNQAVLFALDATDGETTASDWSACRSVAIGSSKEDVIAAFGEDFQVDKYDPHFITYYLNADHEVIPDGDDAAWMISFAFTDEDTVIYLCARTAEAQANPIYGA